MNTTSKELISQFKLPGYVAGKSFAEASKAINKRFEGRNDITSKSTKTELLNRLAQAQEYLKSQEQPEPSIDSTQMAWGGFEDSMIGQGFKEDATGAEQSQSIGAGLNTLTSAIDLGKVAFGKPQQDTSGVAASEDVNAGGMIAGSALKGAQAGAALGPIGAGAGALIGGVAGLFGAKKAKKAALTNSNNFARRQNLVLSDNYAMGGVIDPPVFNTKNIVKYQPGVTSGKDGSSGFYLYSKLPTESDFNVDKDREFVKNENMMSLQRTPQWQSFMKSQSLKPNINKDVNIKYSDNITTDYDKGGKIESVNYLNPMDLESIDGANINDFKFDTPNIHDSYKSTIGDNINYAAKQTGKFIGDNYSTALRYAPALMNAIQLAKLKKPEGVVLNKLNNRYKPTYTDLAQQQNIANQELNNTVSSIEQSGASQSQTRAAILGSQLNKNRALSQAYAQAQLQNAAQDATAQQFNLGIDQTNLQQANLQRDINARLEGNYDTRKSQMITDIAENLRDIGKEQLFKQYPKLMGLVYDSNGKVLNGAKQDSSGNWYDKNDKLIATNKGEIVNEKPVGGYLNPKLITYINKLNKK